MIARTISARMLVANAWMLAVAFGCSYETIDTQLRVASSLSLVDLDIDGIIDVAAGDGDFVATVRNVGGARFLPPDTQVLAGVVRFEDVSGDGVADALLAGGDCVDGGLPFAVGRVRAFGAASCLPFGNDVVAADITGDGARELVFSEGGALFLVPRVLQGLGAPEPLVWVMSSDEPVPGDVAVAFPTVRGDFDGDGREDFFVGDLQADPPRVLLMRGGADAAPVAHPTPISLDSDVVVTAGDVDDDGDLDIVQAIAGVAAVNVYTNAGDGNLDAPREVSLGDDDFTAPDIALRALAIVDFDDDGHNDLVGLAQPHFGQPNGSVVRGTGGGFEPRLQREDMPGVSNLAIGDVDSDGTDDLAAATDDGKLRLYLSSR